MPDPNELEPLAPEAPPQEEAGEEAGPPEVAPEEAAPAEPVVPGEPAEVALLPPLQRFLYKNRVYTRRRITAAGVRALSDKGDKVISIPPDTVVKPLS